MRVMKLLDRILAEERRAVRIAVRVVQKVWEDGFIHAGNLAYLSMLALFPFFIIVGTVASLFGRSEDGALAVEAFLRTLPPSVARLLGEPISSVMNQTSAGIITLSILVGLWTTASYIETIRDILARAYKTPSVYSIWRRRLGSLALILGSVFVMLVAFAAQIAFVGAERFVESFLPWASGMIEVGRIGPMAMLVIALYVLFLSLTPGQFRKGSAKWPGAVTTAAVWIGASLLLPRILANITTYDRFYGPLAGVMITLIFFFIVGMGFVVGAELNAALALEPENGQKAKNGSQVPQDEEG